MSPSAWAWMSLLKWLPRPCPCSRSTIWAWMRPTAVILLPWRAYAASICAGSQHVFLLAYSCEDGPNCSKRLPKSPQPRAAGHLLKKPGYRGLNTQSPAHSQRSWHCQCHPSHRRSKAVALPDDRVVAGFERPSGSLASIPCLFRAPRAGDYRHPARSKFRMSRFQTLPFAPLDSVFEEFRVSLAHER